MDLEEFVASTLTQISAGIAKAQVQTAESGAWINPAGKIETTRETLGIAVDTNARVYLEHVEFDVAVTVATDQAAGAKGAIKVLGLQLGADGRVNYENSSVSRVQFRIPVAWPGDRDPLLEQKRAEARRRQDELVTSHNRGNPWVTRR